MKAPRPDALAVPRPFAVAGETSDRRAGSGARMPIPARPDEELASLAAARGAGTRDAAFDELYRRYRSRVRRIVGWRLPGDEAGAEEITQEVFFQLYRSLPRYAGSARFRTWFWALVRNVCRHQLRRVRGRRSTEAEEPADDRLEIAAAGPDAVERLTRGELRDEVRRQVARLPEVYRTTLLLRDWEEMSYLEIAEALGVPVGTVRSRLHKARALLASALRDDALEGGDHAR